MSLCLAKHKYANILQTHAKLQTYMSLEHEKLNGVTDVSEMLWFPYLFPLLILIGLTFACMDVYFHVFKC